MDTGASPRVAAFWGPDHESLGEIALELVTPSLAVALSRGRFAKGYPHLDVNEDGVLGASDGRAAVLAVVDGHNGFDAARAALRAVQGQVPMLLAGASGAPDPVMRRTFALAADAVADAVAGRDGDRATSGTALCVALVGPARVTVGCRGDCAALVVRCGRVRRVGREAPFLGSPAGPGEVLIARSGLRTLDRVVVASDGVAEFLGRAWKRQLGRLVQGGAPADAARRLVEAAFRGGAGDNIAVVVAEA